MNEQNIYSTPVFAFVRRQIICIKLEYFPLSTLFVHVHHCIVANLSVKAKVNFISDESLKFRIITIKVIVIKLKILLVINSGIHDPWEHKWTEQCDPSKEAVNEEYQILTSSVLLCFRLTLQRYKGNYGYENEIRGYKSSM